MNTLPKYFKNPIIIDFLKYQALQAPGKTLFEIKRGFRYQYFTYLDTYKLSQKTAFYLYSSGLRKGDKVVIWGPNSPEWVIAFFGLSIVGITVVSLDNRFTIKTAKKFINHVHPKLIFYSKSKKKITLIKQLQNSSKKCQTICLEDLVSLVTSQDADQQSLWPKVFPKDIAQIVYTSGTTSEPRGVVLNHRGICANAQSVMQKFPIEPNYKFLSILPLTHMFEQVIGLLCPICAGATITYLGRISSFQIVNALKKRNITHMIVVPAVLKALQDNIMLEAEKKKQKKKVETLIKIVNFLPVNFIKKAMFKPIHKRFGNKLEFFSCGGAPLSPYIEKFWNSIGIPVMQGYGLTEAGVAITINTPKERKFNSVGKLVPGVKVRLSKSGEIYTKSVSNFQGYYQDPKKTKKTLIDGWLKTGDIGFFDKDNFLYISGRKKNIIVLPNGENIFPEDIEKELNANPIIKDSCVIGKGKKGGQKVHAVILTDKPRAAKLAIRQLNEKLETNQKISGFNIYPNADFPRTPTLKIKRGKVIEWMELGCPVTRRQTLASKEPPRDKLLQIVSIITDINDSDIKEASSLNLDLKMDSLQRLELLSHIENRFEVIIDESKINANTTIADLRKLIKKGEKYTKIDIYSMWPLKKQAAYLRNIFQLLILFPLITYFCRLTVEGKDNLKNLKLPALFIFNHTSHFDIPLIYKILPSFLRKKVATGAARDYWFENKFLSSIIALFFNAFPIVRTGSARASIEYIGQLLDKGWSIVISPEGTRSMSGKLGTFKSGVGFVACKMKVPIVPIKIDGLYNVLPKGSSFPKRNKVRVKIGKPLEFGLNADYHLATEKIRDAFKSL